MSARSELDDYDYELPEGCIATEPSRERDLARLLVHERASGESQHRVVRDLPAFLRAGDLLVVNDTRVLRARLFARRASGGRVEFLLLAPSADGTWSALAQPARRLREGEELALEGAPFRLRLVARARTEDGQAGPEWQVALLASDGSPADVPAVLERAGHVPLPPYMRRAEVAADAERYQTVYAAVPGAVAAPTAGLHFTPALLERLAGLGVERASVTLHVGPGTFRPVEVERLEQHVMHAERFELSPAAAAAVARARARGGRVVAVGTTVVRVLESCADEQGALTPRAGETRLFLRPGARFRAVDALLTNFHLPRSTLLMLVSAFAGRERVLGLYREALERGYRFYSYGDAMLLL